MALIQPLALELPCASGAAKKREKKKKILPYLSHMSYLALREARGYSLLAGCYEERREKRLLGWQLEYLSLMSSIAVS